MRRGFAVGLPRRNPSAGAATTDEIVARNSMTLAQHQRSDVPAAKSAPASFGDEAQAAYKAWFECSDDCLFVIGVNSAGKFTFETVNAAYERKTGIQRRQLEGKTPHEALPASVADAVTDHYRHCVRAGSPIRYDTTLEFPSGVRQWRTSLTPVRNRQGKIRQILGSAWDRTDETEALELAAKSLRLLQGVIEAAPDIIYLVDLVGARLNVIGGPVKEVLGYTEAEIADLTKVGLKAIVHPDDAIMLQAHRAWTKRMDDDVVATTEKRVRCADGTYKWLSCREKILNRDAAGCATTLLGVATSIQDQKELERLVKLAHANLRRTLRSITDCYFTLDHTYRLTDINHACLEWMGARRNQVVGTNFWDWCGPAAQCAGLTKEALEMRRPMHAEVRSAVRPDRWLDYHVYPSGDGAVVFFHDITDRKLAEQKAESSNGLLLAALNALSAHIAILDPMGFITGVNSAWHRFAVGNGYLGSDHGLGQNYLDICRSAAEVEPTAARVAEQLEATLSGRINHFVLEYVCGNRWFQLQANRFDANDVAYVVVAHEDITELVLVKQTLTTLDGSQRREVSQLMRQSVVNRLSSSIAHELNQPLTAVMSNAEAAIEQLTMEPPDIDGAREALQDIVTEDKRAADVISRVRSLIKRDSGNLEYISVDRIVGATHSLLRNEIVRRGVDLVVDCDRTLPPVRGDFVELQQVLINILMNAMESFGSPPFAEGYKKVTIRTEARDIRVCITVSDNGPGVPRALDGNMFEPFVSTKSEGLGLGLSICTTIAELHGGNIALENNQDGGATATLTLPVAKRE